MFLIAVLSLAGCARMAVGPRSKGIALPAAIDRTAHAVQGYERDQAAQLKQPEYAPLLPFVKDAGLDRIVREAHDHVERARKIDREQVQPLVSQNKPEGAAPLVKAADEATKELDRAREKIDSARALFTSLAKALRDLPSFTAHGAELANPLRSRDAGLAREVGLAQRKHPAKRADLDRRLAKVRTLAEDVRTQQATIDAEANKKMPDLLKVVRSDERMTASAKEAERLSVDLDKRVVDLDRSVTRRLEDMRLDYFVTFGRSTWSEWSDSETESVVYFPPVQISMEMAQKLSSLGSETVDWNLVRRCGLDAFANLPENERSYEFWIEEIDDQAYHKYVESVDGNVGLTDWAPVTDEVFERHEKDLGMEIFVKPYGYYEEEAVTTASPPGMAFVGHSRYGRWSGSTWHWIAPYLFYSRLFDGNHYYRRNEWDLWNRSFRNQRGYYGAGDREEERPYGTNGRLARVYYGNSTWGRTTGFRNYDLSFRGLGPEYRGGGPGGGGK